MKLMESTVIETTDFGSAVLEGLSHSPKTLPPKFLYDEQGSILFDRICNVPEYYVTRTEQAILEERAPEIALGLGERPVIFELGSGTSQKTRVLLDSMELAAYVPIDISGEMLTESARKLRQAYPHLPVIPICADFSELEGISNFEIPRGAGGRALFFPGSTIGNFDPSEALRFLNQCSRFVGPRGHMLVGVDLVKPKCILEPAYDDAAGVTAAFNLNLLHRMRRELGAQVDPSAFKHLARFDERKSRIEMHLVSQRAQSIEVLDHCFSFERGETIHTESSYKYSPLQFESLATKAGFMKKAFWTDPKGLFSVFLLKTAGLNSMDAGARLAA